MAAKGDGQLPYCGTVVDLTIVDWGKVGHDPLPNGRMYAACLNQAVKDLEEGILLFRNQFLTSIVILTGDGKGMQAMRGAGSKCWFCKNPNGIIEQMGVESTSRWGAFLTSVTLERRPGEYQHAACHILNGIAKRTATTL